VSKDFQVPVALKIVRKSVQVHNWCNDDNSPKVMPLRIRTSEPAQSHASQALPAGTLKADDVIPCLASRRSLQGPLSPPRGLRKGTDPFVPDTRRTSYMLTFGESRHLGESFVWSCGGSAARPS